MDSNYSLNSRGIKQAATELINDNAVNLITYIYRRAGVLPPPTVPSIPEVLKSTPGTEHEEIEAVKEVPKSKDEDTIFKNVEVRIGLSIRILAKTNRYYDEELINLILDDIDFLRKESDYLLSFKDPKARKVALDEEYALVQGYIDMDDTISLNQDPDTESRIGRLASDGNCTIQ